MARDVVRAKRERVGTVLLAFVLVFALLAGCAGKQAGPPAQAKEKVVVFARPEDVQFWDPQDHFNLVSWMMDKLIYNTLVEVTPDGQVVPALATEWSVSQDGTVWTFKLRQGVKFHNGEVFDGQSVKVTLERFLNEKLRQGPLWGDLAGVDVVDPYTVNIRLKRPNGALLTALSLTSMLPPKAFAEKGKSLFDHPIGTGPFEFVEYVRGDRIVLKKYPGYWGEKAKVDKIIYRPITEDATRVAGVKTGEIDIADTIPVDDVPALSQDPNIKLIRELAWDQIYLGFKCDKPPFNDKRVRQAVSLALDREAIVTHIMKGGRPSSGLVPQGCLGFHEGLSAPKRDLNKAKELLRQAGYATVKVNLIAPEGWYPKTKEVLEAIRGQLLEAGIETTLTLLDGAAFAERRAAGNYDVYYTGGAHPGGDPDFIFYQRVHDDAMKSGYRNDALNELIEKGRAASDRAERANYYKQAQEIMNEEAAPMIFVYQMEQILAARKNVTGFVVRGDKITDLRYVDKTE